ncbi:hypothetical protein L1987_03908 [Smallanthus sonchifolius]|uniref:Uncharacterized protein n=1 Tax=Smallanthus sonchifolius TaxID=185202 RepID=A0ACB9KC48_9ASTR|nr:hypothetical protein L1987_03908 [Smallanthus sonchifolius]
MGCFLGCFGSSNDQKRKKQRYKVVHRDRKLKIQDILKADASLEQSIKEIPFNPFSESREKTEEVQLSLKRRKKVTFDTNVTTYEHIQVYDSTESLLEKNEKGETFPKSEANSVVLSMPDYRYGNCVESDDEIEDLDPEDYDFDDDDYDLDDEEHYEDDIDDIDDHEENLVPSMELKRNARNRNGYVLSVLNPVENLTQWKALKSNGSTRKPLNFNGQKENLNSSEPDDQNQETAVDASLSNWLVSSEKITRSNKRVACYNTL